MWLKQTILIILILLNNTCFPFKDWLQSEKHTETLTGSSLAMQMAHPPWAQRAGSSPKEYLDTRLLCLSEAHSSDTGADYEIIWFLLPCAKRFSNSSCFTEEMHGKPHHYFQGSGKWITFDQSLCSQSPAYFSLGTTCKNSWEKSWVRSRSSNLRS